MILINMMMAIINLSFEEIKSNQSEYTNKFELLEYVKRSGKEMLGVQLAKPIKPVYHANDAANYLNQEEETEAEKMNKFCDDFSQKTNLLLQYLENTYLSGPLDKETTEWMQKMQDEHRKPSDKTVAEYGFDAIFMNANGP